MRAREFSLTEISLLPDDRAHILKRSFILAGNGDYLVFEDRLEGEISIDGYRAVLTSGQESWRLNLERRGQNRDGTFSYFILEVEEERQLTTARKAFFKDSYYRIQTPDSAVLEGAWSFSSAQNSGHRNLHQSSRLTILNQSSFLLDDSFRVLFREGNREQLRALQGEGSWNLEDGQLILSFDRANPDSMQGEILALYFLGFNGNQMRLIDQRGFLWKLQKKQ